MSTLESVPRVSVTGSPLLGLRPNRFQYLWLKYVTGFKASMCCQLSLLGPRSAHVARTMRPDVWFPLDEHRAPYVYLCGSLGRYETNVHVAAVAAVGESFVERAASGTVFHFENLRRIAIPEPSPLLLGRFGPKQLACRNWRFGAARFLPGAPLGG